MASGFKWDDFEEVQSANTPKSDGFDWNSYEPVDVQEPKVSQLESANKGLFSGLSFGLDDELAGGLEAVGRVAGLKGLGAPNLSDTELTTPSGFDKEAFVKAYEEARDKRRSAKDEAQAANPGTFLTGQVAGSLTIPGASAVKGLSNAGRVAVSGGQGALAGFGESEEQGLGLLRDTAIGGALGAGLQYGGEKLVQGAQKVFSKADDWGNTALKKFGKVAANVPEDVTERYMQRSKQINESLPLEDTAEYFMNNALPDFKKNLGNLSNAAWDQLDSTPGIEKSAVLKRGADLMEEILKGKRGNLTRNAGTGAASAELSAIQGQLDEIASAYGDKLSEADMKSIVQSLQKLAYSMEGAPASSVSGKAISKLSGTYNDMLKSGNEAYAQQMIPVAAETGNLSSLERQFINRRAPEEVDKFLQKASKFNRLSPDSEAVSAIKELDRTTGAGIEDMIKDRLAFDQFNKTSEAGSRKTMLGGLMGHAAHKALGMGVGAAAGYGATDSSVGALMGASAGFSADKYAGRAFKAMLDGKIQGTQVMQQIGPRMGKFAKPLMDAAARGNQSLAATHFLLSQSDAEYRKKLEELENGEDDK